MTKQLLENAARKHPDLILPPYDEIIKQNGFDAICSFCAFFGGTAAYVPTARTIFAECLCAEAKRELEETDASFVKITRKYGFSERYLRKKLYGK